MIKLFKNLTKKEVLLMIISFILIGIDVWFELKLPDYMSKITILVETEGSKMKDILINGGYMLLCTLISLISAIGSFYFIARITSNFSKITREKLFNKVESLSLSQIKLFKTSSLITRTTNDITQVEMLLGFGMQMIIKAPFTAVVAITKIINKNLIWTGATAIAILIILIGFTIVMIIVIPRFKIVQKLTDKLNGVERENLLGIRVIRAFNAENYSEDKFNDVNEKLTNIQLSNQKTFALMSPAMYLIMHSLTLAVYFIGAILISNSVYSGKLTLFSNMVVFSSYSMQVIMSFLMLVVIFMMAPRAMVSAKRINEVLDSENLLTEGKVTKTKDNSGTVEFKNVSFKYPDAEAYVLENISFKINSGETVAFIGSTGSGKSTLINLVPRFYEATEGEILVDGVNVKDYKFASLHKKIGYVSQNAILFNGSVKKNVNFGDNHTDQKGIEEAIKVAQANDFVLKMDKKYDSFISQGGTNISGGQKQRLSIARAIARKPEIFIFDDSFSALDYKTDSILRKELKKYTKKATNLIVATRIGTILNADKIVVLDKGKCVGIGTHKELLKNCEVYKQIALSQVSEEELNNA